ncbi:unnamed protein product [Brassica rapa]|uniref:Uncharacterized protein n=2 Tax=Brassica TaxID=3705 RepID=A0A8D9D9X4_BRACM|nr:unnamed protein product [Brassica napus]CAG7871624.1 unnamed protein product [Brassica rapa]
MPRLISKLYSSSSFVYPYCYCRAAVETTNSRSSLIDLASFVKL